METFFLLFGSSLSMVLNLLSVVRFSLGERKNELQKEDKYRCEQPNLSSCLRPVIYDMESLAQQLLQILAVLAGVIDDPLQPLALGVARAKRARRIVIVDRLDRTAGVVERAGHATHHFFAR